MTLFIGFFSKLVPCGAVLLARGYLQVLVTENPALAIEANFRVLTSTIDTEGNRSNNGFPSGGTTVQLGRKFAPDIHEGRYLELIDMAGDWTGLACGPASWRGLARLVDAQKIR